MRATGFQPCMPKILPWKVSGGAASKCLAYALQILKRSACPSSLPALCIRPWYPPLSLGARHCFLKGSRRQTTCTMNLDQEIMISLSECSQKKHPREFLSTQRHVWGKWSQGPSQNWMARTCSHCHHLPRPLVTLWLVERLNRDSLSIQPRLWRWPAATRSQWHSCQLVVSCHFWGGASRFPTGSPTG